MKVTSRGNCHLSAVSLSLTWLLLSVSYFGSCPDGIFSRLPPFNPVPLFSPLRFQLHGKCFYETEKRSSENWHFIYEVNSRSVSSLLIFKLDLAHQLLLWVKKKYFPREKLNLVHSVFFKRICSCSFMKKQCIKNILRRLINVSFS